MFGYLRFILACFVLASHTGISLQGFNIGVFAVICFFMLAGYVVAELFDKFFGRDRFLYFEFYFERALRIFPQYFFVLILTIVFVSYSGFFEIDLSAVNILSSLIILPLNWNSFLDFQTFIPPAWSLAIELKAYLLLPFVVYFQSLKVVLALLSVIVFLFASLGFINTDLYSLNTIFGTFFIFVIGVSIYASTKKDDLDLFDIYFPPAIYLIMILLMIVLGVIYREMIFIANVMEVALAIIIGLPIIYFIANKNINLPYNGIFGDLSYGVFLSHFLVINVINHYTGITFSYGINESNAHISPVFYVVSVFIFSVLVSLIALYLIERPIKKYRFHITKNLK